MGNIPKRRGFSRVNTMTYIYEKEYIPPDPIDMDEIYFAEKSRRYDNEKLRHKQSMTFLRFIAVATFIIILVTLL